MRALLGSNRWLIVAALVAGLGVLAAWAMMTMRSPELAKDPLAAAPAGTSVVMHVDVPAVRASHLWRLLLEEEGAGQAEVERVCGYDPLAQVEEAFVFVSGTADEPFGELGLVARGQMARGAESRRRLLDCVGAVAGKGDALERVDVEGVPAIVSSGGSHAAFVGADAVLAGDRSMVARVIQVARGEVLSTTDDETLRRLWSRVSTDRDLVAVARLPDRWVPALRRMAAQVEGDLRALATIRALGVGVRVRGGLSIGLAAETQDAEGAHELERALLGQIDGLMAGPLVRLSTVGRVLRRVRTEAHGSELVVTASVSDAQLDSLRALWRDLRARGEGASDRVSEEAPVESVAVDSEPPDAPGEPAR